MHGFLLLSFQGYVLNHGLIPPPDDLFGADMGPMVKGFAGEEWWRLWGVVWSSGKWQETWEKFD
nr:hypothetical protein [Tanacetum cinerariifolium]